MKSIDCIEDLVIDHIKTATKDKYISSVVQLSGDCSVFLNKIQASGLTEDSDISFYVANSTPEAIRNVDPSFKYAGSGFKTNRLSLPKTPPTIVYADFSFSNSTDELVELIGNTKAVAAYVVLPSDIEVDPSEDALDKSLRHSFAKLIKIGEYEDKSAYLVIISSAESSDNDPLGHTYMADESDTYMADESAWTGVDTAWGHDSSGGFISSLHIASKTNTVICHGGRLPLNHAPEQIIEKAKNLEEIQALYDADREKIESLFVELANLDPHLLIMLKLKSYSFNDIYSNAISNLDKDYWNSIRLLVKPQLQTAISRSSRYSDATEDFFREAIHPMCREYSKYESFSANTVRALSNQIIEQINEGEVYTVDNFYFSCIDRKTHQMYKMQSSYCYLLPNKIKTDAFLSFDTSAFEIHKLPLDLHDLHNIAVPLKNLCTFAGVNDLKLSLDGDFYKAGSKIEFMGTLMGEKPRTLLTLQLFKNGNQLMEFDDKLIRNINILINKTQEGVRDPKIAFEEMGMEVDFDSFEDAYNQVGAGEHTLKDTLLGSYI